MESPYLWLIFILSFHIADVRARIRFHTPEHEQLDSTVDSRDAD